MPIVSVLAGLAVLTSIAVSLLWSGTMSYRLARGGLDVGTIEATAEAAVARAVLGLLDPRPERRWRADGVAQAFAFDGVAMRITIQDELGRIDLNHADAGLLSGLLQSAGLDPQAASALTDKILDWRDPSPGHRPNGAKAQNYRLAGLPQAPRNGAFQSVDELRLVMDMTPALFDRIAPALTVYSGRQFIDPQVAPREALLAMRNMDQGKTDALLAQRAGQQAAPLAAGGDAVLPLRGRAFSIRAEFGEAARRHVHEAAVRLTDDPARPFWVLHWRTM